MLAVSRRTEFSARRQWAAGTVLALAAMLLNLFVAALHVPASGDVQTAAGSSTALLAADLRIICRRDAAPHDGQEAPDAPLRQCPMCLALSFLDIGIIALAVAVERGTDDAIVAHLVAVVATGQDVGAPRNRGPPWRTSV